MKKGILTVFSLIITLIVIGVTTVSAADETSESKSVFEEYVVDYESNQLMDINGVVTPQNWVYGALAGGLIYDAVKGAVTYGVDVHQKYGNPVNMNQDYQQLANQQGPWSENPNYTVEFGR